MGTLIGFAAAVAIVVSTLVIVAIGVGFALAVRSTVVANRADLALRADLDAVLADVLNPRRDVHGPSLRR